MRIAVLLSDRVALPALDYLFHLNLVVAVGMPDRPSEILPVVVARCQAAGVGVTLFKRRGLGEALLDWLRACQPEVVLVKTFPYLIPVGVLSVPVFGFVNFHYAPLPAWRGTNPLFWMIRNGATMGGVTVHEMTSGYDEGPVLLEQAVPIGHNVNFGILYTQLAHVGLRLTAQLIDNFSVIFLERREQDHAAAVWYGQPTAADCRIDWMEMDAVDIFSLVRACNPWNKGAATLWREWTFGITYASVVGEVGSDVLPGTILSIDSGSGFSIASRDGKVILAEVVYCEEGYYPGYCLSVFGLQKGERLGKY